MAYQFDSGQAHQIGRRKNILISAPTLLIKYLVLYYIKREGIKYD